VTVARRAAASSAEEPAVSLEKQLDCARRELALRKRVYPGWVNAKRLNAFKAEDEIAAMAAIVKTLEGLQSKALV
jgi:hypothetical protein